MPQNQRQTPIIRHEHLSADIFRITAHAPEIAEQAKPGQFVMVKTTEGYDPLLRRPFSIHQATANGRLQILYKVLGKGTKLLAKLKEGDTLNMLGPLGKGFSTTRHGRICLVGGGMGVAPLFFLANELTRQRDPSQILVLLGARNAEELQPLADGFQKIGLQMKLATDDGSLGHHGLVIDLMDDGMKHAEPWQVYTCGPYPMLKAIANKCAGMQWSCQVSLETMMACGVSACLGCAVPKAQGEDEESYLHVCKDGPVFDAREVSWL